MAAKLCEGKTTRGATCRKPAVPGRPYCGYHDPDVPHTPLRGWADRVNVPADAEGIARRDDDEQGGRVVALTLIGGGAGPELVAAKTAEAARALEELAAVMSPDDVLKHPIGALALCLAGRARLGIPRGGVRNGRP